MKYTRLEDNTGFGRLGYCCSVDVLMESFAKHAVYDPKATTPQYEPKEKTRERLQRSINKILTRAEIKPVFFATRSDKEDVFEEMLKEMPEYFSLCTQVITSHGYPEGHTVSVWVAHKHNHDIPNKVGDFNPTWGKQVVEEGVLAT